MKISVFGDGAWGTALAMNLLHNRHEVMLWGAFPDYLKEMYERKENFKFLPGVPLPSSLVLEPDIEKAARFADVALFVTPTQFLRSVLQRFKPFYNSRQIIVNAAKGIEMESWLRISEVIQEELGSVNFVDLSGPSHAEEVSLGVPTAVVSASENPASAEAIQQLMMNERFRVYTTNDVAGVELGGALKNVMAIAAGIIDGMKLGDNPKAALMTRGIAEMGRLGEKLGGKSITFSGLSGIGDLIVTCTSGHSRNRHVGEELGRGKTLKEILQAMGMVVAEGVWTARGAYTLARRVGADTPIIDEIHNILYHDRPVPEAIQALMTRAAKPE